MNVKFFYTTSVGRIILKAVLNPCVRRLVAGFLKSPFSKGMIKPFIRRNRINMEDFEGQKFRSYAEFFARKRDQRVRYENNKELISPCDAKLSIFPVREDSVFMVKDSYYRFRDLIPDEKAEEIFAGGSCLIYRLEASDYHHFCYVDDCYHEKGKFIEGTLHSVQPIACEKKPVYRMNRRMWSLLWTRNFGMMAQVEVGAMMVGGIVHTKQDSFAERGEEMGHFELAGSTVIQFITKETREKLMLLPEIKRTLYGKSEVRVKQGDVIGVLKE